MYEKSDIDITDDIWSSYIKTHDVRLRNKILTAYAYIATVNAKRMHSVCKNKEELEEVINQSIITLIECIEKFDPSRGVQFDTYASIRIRGSIIDYVRKQDWVPRGVRKKSIDISNAYALLQTEFGRAPTDEEVAEYLHMDIEKLKQITAQADCFALLSYEELLENNISTIESTSSNVPTPEQELMRQEFKDVLTDAIDKLNEKERMVISLYYFNELKLKEIAQLMDLTPSRVSQMHSKALMKLKNMVGCYVSL